MIEYLQRCWKGVLTIVGVLTIMVTLTTFYSNLATSADLKQMKVDIVTEFNKSMELDRNLQRLNNINENLLRLKIQQRQYPKDKEIAEDIKTLKEDKVKLQHLIESR